MKNQIFKWLQEKKYFEIRKNFEKLNVVDIAILIEEIGHETNNETLLLIFRMIPKSIAAEVFAYFSYEEQQKIIEAISDKEVYQIISELYVDDTVNFLEEMPANVVEKVLKNVDSDLRKQINQIFNYPEDSAGSLMTTEFLDLREDMTIGEALQRVRKIGVDRETIDFCYITDNTRKIKGVMSIRKIILSDKDIIISDIMDNNIIFVNTMDDQESIVNIFQKYDFTTIPVVDNEERLVGIITVDDIIDVIEEETTEDMEKMTALMPSEDKYLNMNIFSLSKNRIIWLLFLMFSTVISEVIIRNNNALLQGFIILGSFMPMLMNTGGSAGAQAATLVVRGIALEEIKVKDMLKVVTKELGVGIIISIVLGIITFVRLNYYDKVSFDINIIVTVTLAITIIIANIFGGLLPILAKAIKIDPAVMAIPLITTIVDAIALLTYFKISTFILM